MNWRVGISHNNCWRIWVDLICEFLGVLGNWGNCEKAILIMHVSVLPDSKTCRSSHKSCSQQRRSVLSLATTTDTVAVVGDHNRAHASLTITATCDSFLKDGRKISVGDCALFKPPQDCPPFIGFIRWLKLSEDKNFLLGVNWLYRPAELDLKKDIIVDATPNEIFYSFHEDEILAASLLHPCKVSFLPRGVELPNGTSSFVCRRVYDVGNKCLWWLTDQNFVNERQEDVNQLLHKTKTEMHATFQPDGCSPKQVNGSTSTSQLKPTSDNGQNSGTFPSQVKGKKRERVDHVSDSVKRERVSRPEDGEFLHHKSENKLKCEISRITGKGGVVDLEGVEKLVQLMAGERKMDLVTRSMLAGVMAATDKADCLNSFVQFRGLPVLDGWLQDIHKRKIGDGNNSSLKDSDKTVEEFLLVLLRALDKLPVNLHALQTCNIGRSVNHLRSHKNSEIQKKARSLVDTWKKRVEAEMISIDDTRSSKSRHLDAAAAHGDVAMKSSVTQNSSSKSTSARSSHGENTTKSAASSSPKEAQPSSTSTRSRKVLSVTGSQKEASSGGSDRSHKTQPALSSSSGKGAVSDVGATHKHIVKIPKQASSPAQVSSQVLEADKSDACRNVVADIKVTGEGVEENSCCMAAEDSHKNELICGGKLHASSFGAMNALVESCAKYSEATSSMSAEDDIGINLLASVATGEMSRSDFVLRNDSREKSTVEEGICIGEEAKSKYPFKELCDTEIDEMKCADGFSDDKNHDQSPLVRKEMSVEEINTRVDSPSMSLRNSVDPKKEICNDVSNEKACPASLTPTSAGKVLDFEKKFEVVAFSKINADGISVCKSDGINVTMAEEKSSANHEVKLVVEVNVPNHFSESNCKKDEFNSQEIPSSPSVKSESAEYARILESELEAGDNTVKVREPDEKGCLANLGKLNLDTEANNMDGSCSTSTNDLNKNREEANAEMANIEADPGSVDRVEEEKAEVSSSSSAAKIKFDLNEGFSNEDEEEHVGFATNVDTINYSSRFPINSSNQTGHPASITVVSPAKGPFVPIDDLLLKSKGEVRWKGSAATSAFRPAEPRKVDTPVTGSSSKHGRVLFDFDLNVLDERLLEEMASRETNMATDVKSAAPVRGFKGLDLDLNRADETNDNGICSSSNRDVGRNFDLNVDETTNLLSINNQHIKGNMPAQHLSSSAGLIMNGPPGLSWFPPCNTYPTFPVPSMLPDHRRVGEKSFSVFPPNAPPPQRGFAPTSLVTPDIYRGSVLSSSPAMSFPSGPFQFPVFPFGTTFPVVGSSYTDSARMFVPPVNAPFQRPCVVGLPDGIGDGGWPDNKWKWARQGLDLNAGPPGGSMESEAQHSVSSSAQVLTEEHARMYNIFKRRESDGGFENQNFRFI